ncbi:MAG: HlyD family secretion protein [Candidatus Contendobacter sp.]|nr:HlyD family secretion protein [Candidatus Contendobacter sp.]
MLVISSEHSTATTKDTQETLLRELRRRRDSLKREQVKQADIDTLAASDLAQRIPEFEAELKQAQAQLELQRNRVSSAERTVKRHEALVATRLVSEETLQQKQDDLLEQRSQLVNVQRIIAGLTRDLGSARMERASSALKNANHTAAIDRQISELEQEITETDALQTVALTASAAGTVTTILADVGQAANPGAPLLSILPGGAALHAQLLAPTHAAGFIKPGQSVALRYRAFPYQRFGHYLGEVIEIGRTVIQPNESNLPLPIQEPVYRVTVRLPAQQVSAYGQDMALQAGMVVDADIAVDRRSILEWVFDPLLAVTGRL